MTGAPRVSAVVSHYDRAHWLPEALASVRAQTFSPFEILVVDDAGPAGEHAARTCAAFGARHVRRSANGGVAAVRNTGVTESRGGLIAFLDDDDLWLPHHLGGLVAALDAAPAAAIAYADVEVRRIAAPAGAPTAPATWPVLARLPLAVPFDAADLARDDFIVPGAMLVRRDALARVGAFDETLFVSDDWDWLLRAHATYGDAGFARVPATGAIVRIVAGGAANLSGDFGARRRAALAILAARHGLLPIEPKTFWGVAETYAARSRG